MFLKRCRRSVSNRFFGLTQQFYRPVNIPLDKILVGEQHGIPSQEWFRRTGDRTRFSMLLSDSPYVSFLRQVDDDPQILEDDDTLKETSYFKMADVCRRHTGWYFEATTTEQICEWMRQYYQMYKTFDCDSQIKPVEGRGHSVSRTCPVVNKIADSDLYEVEDGHHRLAIMLAKGYHLAQVVVRSRRRTYLQQQLLRVNQIHGKELYQPVPFPEVQTWSLIRKCQDRLEMILRFLEQQKLNGKHTVVDCACSYGWFVKQFKDHSFTVLGLDRDTTVIQLGRLIYDLEESDFECVRLEDFLSTSIDKFDVVLCLSLLHHYALGNENASPEDIVAGLSRITNKVLFVDTGQSHEQWFHRTLPEWNTDFIRRFLLKHGDFTEVMQLGVDTDNVGKFKNNYRRGLFACLK